MACSDYKTECLRVVNIAYLKEFIGNNVQNSSDGTTKYVDSSEDRYCPTYGELTGGTYIQTWSQGTSPRGDRDGIVVSQTWAGDGSRYADNQLVDQRDLSLRYTRFNELSIERTSPNDIMSACSGTTGLRYTYNYKRYIKSMNANNCAISTSNSTVNDACSALTYTTTFQGLSNSGSSVTNCTTYKVYKNGDFSSENRDDTVYATARFRGTPYTSNSVIIKQAGLSGSYSKEISTREVTTKVTASAASQTSFDCNGGEYSARGTRHYKIVAKRAYVDVCGKEYSQTKEFDKVTGLTQNLESGGTFGYYNCCEGGHSETKKITFVRDGLSSQTITFTQSCTDCSSDPGCVPTPACSGVAYTIYPDKQISCSGGDVTFSFEGGCSCSLLDISTTSMSFAETGETKTASFTLAAACGLDWTKPSWITVSESRDDDGTGTLSCTASENDSGSGRTGTVTLKVNDSSCHTISVSQDGEEPPTPPTPVECPERGDDSFNGVIVVFEHQLDAVGSYDGGIIGFNTGNTAFASVKSVEGDGTVVTSASMLPPDGTLPTGWTRVAISHSTNPTTSTRSGFVTVTMTKTDGDDCSYVANFTQKAGTSSTISVTFNFINATSSSLNGTIEIECTGKPSFTIPDVTASVGTPVSKTVTLTSDYSNASISYAEFQSSSGNMLLDIEGTNVITDGATINMKTSSN